MNKKIKGAVVVTGASSGIGQACALALAKAGFQVIATVRKQKDRDKLESLGLQVDFLDVTQEESVREFASRLQKSLGDQGLLGLVNNAGLAIPGPMEVLPISELRRQIEINLIGQIAVTQALLPLIRKARGRIIMMSSLSGRITFPFMGAYCASKYGLEAASDALRLELRPWGIHVSLIEPGRIRTKIFEKADSGLVELEKNIEGSGGELYREVFEGAYKMLHNANDMGIEPSAVTKAVVHAMTSKSPKVRYPVGADAWKSILMKWFLPDRWTDGLLDFLFKKALQGWKI